MEAQRRLAPGRGCGHPPPSAAGPEPVAAPVSVPAPPQGPAVGGGLAGFEFAPPQEPEPRAPGTWAGAAAGPPTPSAHIPVPALRAPQGKVQLDEVMAAAALTSLSTSPLLLRPPAAALSTDACLEPWPQTLGQPPGSYSSSSSGDWGWDPASEQSCPSSPSPPLPPEAAFLFGEPAPQKRKSSGQVLFQCLWKRCGKVLSTASGMQRHIRLVHLGRRQAEPEQSDGEEDFYYTELGIGLEVLTDGLSSLSPMSPTASLLPTCPHLELPEPAALPSLLHPLALPPPQVLSPAAPPQVCHNDHSYQGCLASTELQPQPSTVRACVPAVPAKLSANLRKPRGDAKKCRKVYGTERRDLWCTACRWKKACQRFLD
ncbi:SLC2A4 regulator isoform X2 [Myotis daubentonii]|uniref:SLC2A4 regulator isoform X2 n=1 Tax=Myotis daubentonii TaxID=98922 RepID=UPI002873431B|nr:SLC2A4 regulator isoform X2 [Myotis daubentonii]